MNETNKQEESVWDGKAGNASTVNSVKVGGYREGCNVQMDRLNEGL